MGAIPEGRAGPNGPDGKPLFARHPEFVAVYLVSAADVLVRMGEVEVSVFEDYLAQLRALNSKLATTYVETSHCSVSFLTDTTTLKLMREWLADDGQISAASLYNVVIGQTFSPAGAKWRSSGPSTWSLRRLRRLLPSALAEHTRAQKLSSQSSSSKGFLDS